MSFEIFRAGRRTTSKGQTLEFSDADIAAAAAAYDPATHEAPIVIGHPGDTAPAYGWIKHLAADGGSLKAEFKEVDNGFSQLVREGRYKKVSASFYPPDHPANPKPGVWYLRHLGFLGAQPPAIKGLDAIAFSETDGCVEFSELAFDYSAGIFRRLRDWFIGKFGVDEADKVIPDYMIESLQEAPHQDTPAEQAAFSEPPFTTHENHETSKETVMPTEEQLAAEKAAREKAEAEAAQAKAELKRLQDEQEQSLRTASHDANANFAEALAKEGKLKPADKALVVQILDFAEHPQHTTADFKEAGSAKPLAQAIRDFLNAQPQVMDFAEVATADKAGAKPAAALADFAEANPDALSHHQRALALSKKEGVSYEEAARRTVQ